MKAVLARARVVSALAMALAGRFTHPRPGLSSQAAALPPLRTVRPPQGPKPVRPAHSPPEPAGSPAHPLARPAAIQPKA